jgi:hypothetical protein
MEVSAMPVAKRVPLVAILALGSLVFASMPVLGQETEEFVGPDAEALLSGYTRSDGTIVLSDESFCRYLQGSLWGERKLTYVDLLDRSKKQKKARRAAFDPAVSQAAITRCVDVLTASRTAAPDGDTLPAWARGATVVPEALAGLLPEDFVAQPLAQPEHIGDAARTSGFGDLVSAPFSVAPGPWLAQLDASACDSWQGTLHDARDPALAFPLANSREYLYELTAGHYYWDVTAADCDWSVDLVPVQLGPVPTPTPEPQAIVPALFTSGWDRGMGAENPDHLTAPQAREALFEAGLVPGTCHIDTSGARTDAKIWQQEPVAGSLVDFGTTVDIWVGLDCDIYEGTRVKVE